MSTNHITSAINNLMERFDSASDVANHLRRVMTTTGRPSVTFSQLCVEVKIARVSGEHFHAATVQEITDEMVTQECQDSGRDEQCVREYLRRGVAVGRFLKAKTWAVLQCYVGGSDHLPFIRVNTMKRAADALEQLCDHTASDDAMALRAKLVEFAELARSKNLQGDRAFYGLTTDEIIEQMDPTLERV